MTRLAFKVAVYAVALVASVGSYVAEARHHTPIEQAVQNPARPDDDRARDEARRPAEVLAFFGVEPGMRVMEVGGGSGYYTEILNYVVGGEGKVIAQNGPGPFYESFLKEPLATRYKDGRLENAEQLLASAPDWELEDGSLDAVFIFLIYHHMHIGPDGAEAMPESTVATLAKLRAALKPGGLLGLIEHRAADGATRAESAAWHRITDAVARADMAAAGFAFDGASDMFTNAEDDQRNYWRESGMSGKTTRIVHRYRKPAE
ncbi:MAG: class I SAM-dependent methyltransferase [Proteobacteria bacterium]|nr:class I SAM-dependent methyltransferase [Pseudomonadota bacterium]